MPMGRKLFILFICVLTFFSFQGCKKGNTASKAPDVIHSSPNIDLHVIFVSPKGRTEAPHESEAIVVVFNQPMIPLEALSERKPPSILRIEPSFPGVTRWLNTKTLTFTPEKRFPYATEIRVTIPAGTSSLSGATLKEDYSWTFQTILLRLVGHFPRHNQKWVKLASSILLVFNQPVEKEKAKDFISLLEVSKTGKEAPLDFRASTPSEKQLEEETIKASPEEVLLVEPKEKFKPDFSYYVEIRAGLPGKEGPLGLDKGSIFRFETFMPFRLEKLETAEKHDPYDPLPFHFSNPVFYKEFVKKLHFQPSVSIPDYYLEWEQANAILRLSLPLQPETEYSVKIDPDLRDEFGNELGEEAHLRFSTAPYSPSVTMNTGYGIIEAYGDLRYPLYVVNTNEVLLQGAIIKKEEIIPLLMTEKILWSSERLTKKDFFRLEKPLKINPPRNKRDIFPIELSDILPKNHGLIFLQLDTYLPDKWSRYPKALLQVTELGISAKFSPDNNLVWVTELQTGKPVPEAQVEIRDDSNKICWQGKTDEKGRVQTPGWKPLGIKSKDEWRQPQQWVFVSRGEDLAFTSSYWESGVSPYLFGISYEWNPQPIKMEGYLFTERGIYRAGETVHIKGIIREREKGEWQLPSAEEIECEILDPFQKSVFKKKIKLDSYGSFTLDFSSEEKASLGHYQIRGNIPSEADKKKPITVYGSFRIEAFEPAEFEVHLQASKKNYIFGDNFEAEVRASYLFGGVMSGQKLTWHLRLNPASYSPPGYKGYIFGNQIDRWEESPRERSRLLSSGEATLDSKGTFKISAKLAPEKEKDSALAALEATVESPSRRSISSRIQTIVHRGEYYIGLRPSTTFLKKGEELGVDLITVLPEGRFAPEKNIRLALIKREWNSVRRKGMGGRYLWRSEKKDTEVASQTVLTKNEPQKVSFLPDKSGFYLIQAEGQDSRDNNITTTTYCYVTGRDYIPWERRDDDTVELVADSEEYRPGDVAKILVKSPYTKASALITLERELILEHRILEIQGSSEEIEVPISSDHIPNIFVSVLLVQGRTSPRADDRNEDIGKPQFKIGYVNLKVNPSEKQLHIDVEKDKDVYRPREKVHLTLKVKDWEGKGTQASLTLAVVDLGVLSLIGYQTPDPFSTFYTLKPLSVQTSDTRFHLIGQREYGEKGEDVGGGAGGAERMKAMVPGLAQVELRGDFKATAYWNASLEADEEGKASVSFTLPDNLTTFRVMAVAQTRDSRFGRAESDFRTSKPLMLLPALPRFARVGDRFQAGVVVHNTSPKKENVTLSCESTGIKIKDQNTIRHFSLKAGEAKEVLYSFEVEKPGMAIFSFRAKMGENEDGLEIPIPLKMPRPTESVAFFEKATKSQEHKIRIPKDIYASESKVEILASPSALSGLRGCVDYLTSYPYLCLEQRLSSILPYLVAFDVIIDFNLSKLDQEQIRDYVQKNIKEFSSYQKESGGFGFWPDSRYESPYISCYATFGLVLAKKAGYEVKEDFLSRAASYLRDLLRQKDRMRNSPYSERCQKTVRAFALYCLALLDKPEPSYAEKLFTERESLSLFGKTLLLKALFLGKGPLSAQTTLVGELMNKIKVEPTLAHFEDDEGREGGWIYASNLRTTALILQSLLEVGSDHPLLPDIARWLLQRRKVNAWNSTQQNFFVFYALNEFYRKQESIEPDFKVEIFLEKQLLLRETFRDRQAGIVSAEKSLDSFPEGKTLPLKINLDGKGTLYYETRMTYAPQYKLMPRDEGFGLSKELLSLEGKPLESIKAGSLVVVRLRIVVPRESLFVVVNDPLPAGFEAVNPTFVTESEEQQRSLLQLEREQRRRWWEGFNHIEMHDDRVLLFADSLSPGIHTHTYLARALSFGTFQTPGTKVEEMYSPEVFGRGEELTVEISK